MNKEPKICSICKKEYPATSEYFHKHKKGKNGLHPRCRKCTSEYNKKYYNIPKNKKRKKERQNTPEFIKHKREYDLNRSYNINTKAYNILYEVQDGKCAYCGIWKKRLDIDHNHITNKIRGLLCSSCNLWAGHIEKYIKNPKLWNKYLGEKL